MQICKLKLTLLSDATMGRGDGVAGLVDAEVEHDAYGIPYLRGRALKGLLAEECANILFGLQHFMDQNGQRRWHAAAQALFGRPGSGLEDGAGLHVGDATLPPALRQAIIAEVQAGKYAADDVLASLTAVRRQTAMEEDGVPAEGSLRAMRVILRETTFEAGLSFAHTPTADELALLAACVCALRRVGTGRNRGRGRVRAGLCDAQGQDLTAQHLAHFEREVKP